ncbi:MAG TPA: hypothetical protein VG889_08380 [Rhizomicrobium sp.]|nr:hypothetical protein [Rhizomicrobium sp.]
MRIDDVKISPDTVYRDLVAAMAAADKRKARAKRRRKLETTASVRGAPQHLEAAPAENVEKLGTTPPENSEKLGTTAAAFPTPQDLVPPKRRPGGQPGNSNAQKHGFHSADQRARRGALRLFVRRTDAALAHAKAQVRLLKAKEAAAEQNR